MDQSLLDLYTDYLLSSFGSTTAAGLSTLLDDAISHDKITRFLSSQRRSSADFWKRVKPLVRTIENPDGVLIIDDSIEEKPYTNENDLIGWNGDHSKDRNVKGINFMTALYHAKSVSIPVAEEFIISNSIQIHPMALIDYDKLEDPSVKAEIDRLTAGYADKPQFFVDKLAQGVAMIGAAFYPNDVIVRLSDFKTNEYANQIGGKKYEPAEENPMLGFRGASRYYHPHYRDSFALECRAMKKVRDEPTILSEENRMNLFPTGGM